MTYSSRAYDPAAIENHRAILAGICMQLRLVIVECMLLLYVTTFIVGSIIVLVT
jgi:hypothetical protein